MSPKPWIVAILMPVVIGTAGLMQASHRPEFAALRMVDIVQLTGSGACFGVAMVAIVMLLRGKRVGD